MSVHVFDIRGRRVATLLDDTVDSGRRVVRWDGRAENGAFVASGAYLWKISGFDEVITRRMMILK